MTWSPFVSKQCWFVLFSFLLLIAMSKTSAVAQSESAPYRFAPDSTKRLAAFSLEDFLATVNANHPKLNLSKLSISKADANIKRAWGGLDPSLQADYQSKNESDKLKSSDFHSSLTIPTFWGPKVVAGFRHSLGFSDVDNNTPSNGELTLSISAPLWRNVLIDKNRANIQKAEVLSPGLRADFERDRNELFLTASEKYWEWSSALARFSVAENLLRLATTRIEGMRLEQSKGERAKIDLVEADQEIQRRQGTLIKARRDVERSEISVATFLWDIDGKSISLPKAVAPSSPLPRTATFESLDSLLKISLKQRPELARLEAEISAAGVDRDLAGEQWKPELNASFSPFTRTLGNTQATSTGSLDYKLGLDLSMPLLFRTANAERQLAEIKLSETDLKRRITEQEIRAELWDALSDVEASREQVTAAERERQSAEQVEEAERMLLDRGESNLFTVNIRERSTAEARQREIDSQLSLAKAIARLRFVTAEY